MASSDGQTTQAFSDPEAIRHRAERDHEADQERGSASQLTSLQTTFSVSQLKAELLKATSTSLPDARLVLAYPQWSKLNSSATISFPTTIDSRSVIGVVQRTKDVRFNVQLPFYDPPCTNPSPRFIPFRLDCNIFYDPASDACLLENRSNVGIRLTALGSEPVHTHLSFGDTHAVEPGMWRVSVGGGRLTEQDLLDFVVLERRFQVAIQADVVKPGTSSKRMADDETEMATKRQRRRDELTEVVLAPVTTVSRPTSRTSAMDISRDKSKAVATSTSIPLVDLTDGDVATITTQSSNPPVRNDTEANYQLARVGNIFNTASTSVFTSRHSAWSADIVTKIIKYKVGTGSELRKSALTWERERKFLEKLKHPNIISLMGFDGRLLAIYTELLPRSLDRGLNSPFKPSDTRVILRDMASALVYLSSKRVAHNDIKPANIAYSPTRGAVLLDFGLATHLDEKTSTGGTPWYIPLDYISQNLRGEPGEVWALGVTMMYVCGRIHLPERMTRPWLIRDTLVEGGEAQAKMLEWVEFVQRERGKLDAGDVVEGLIGEMVDVDRDERVSAARILERLQEGDGGTG